jgi:diguanylate cyclase (GGDEF)-like protein
MRSFDMVARFGGEEFVVLMPETELDVAAKAAARLRAAVAGIDVKSDSGLPIWMTISIGVAAFHPDGVPETPSALLSRADKALYQAKAEGRDRVVCA